MNIKRQNYSRRKHFNSCDHFLNIVKIIAISMAAQTYIDLFKRNPFDLNWRFNIFCFIIRKCKLFSCQVDFDKNVENSWMGSFQRDMSSYFHWSVVFLLHIWMNTSVWPKLEINTTYSILKLVFGSINQW